MHLLYLQITYSLDMISVIITLASLLLSLPTKVQSTATSYHAIRNDTYYYTGVPACEDSISNCDSVKQFCHLWTDELKNSCRKTCGYCGVGCEDKWKKCRTLTEYCNIYPKLKKKCRKSCGFCGTKDHVTCERESEKMGCFKALNTSQMDLIINDEDFNSPYYQGYSINWKEYTKSIHSLACRCEKKARNNGYTFISLRFWGQCWAGRDFGNVIKSKMGSKCVNTKFETCRESDWKECVGNTGHDYIYKLSERAQSPVGDGCVDKLDYCDIAFSKYCDLPEYKNLMKETCRKTCNFCGPKCTDRFRFCFDHRRFCKTNPSRLIGLCDKTCGFCRGNRDGDRLDMCIDKRSDCKNLVQYCGIASYKKQMEKYCPRTCRFCDAYAAAMKSCQMDSMSIARCQYYKRHRYCRLDKEMENLCPETCGFCKLPALNECHATKYGCCWDKKTIKRRKDGRYCPPCVNTFPFLCNMRKHFCSKRNEDGEFLRANCPQTCGLCQGLCQDDLSVGHKCDFWNTKLGYCQRKPQEMKIYCPQTCGFCT